MKTCTSSSGQRSKFNTLDIENHFKSDTIKLTHNRENRKYIPYIWEESDWQPFNIDEH